MAAVQGIRLAAGVLLALALGLAALAAAGLPVRSRWARLGLGLALGVEILVVLGLPLALLGAPVMPAAIVVLGLAVALALGWVAVRRGGRPEMVSPQAADRTPLSTIGAVVLAAAVALALAKLVAVPLWSWDHVAVWGAKSRHLIADGRLDLSFMSGPGFEVTAHYPLGLPFTWRIVALGAAPGELEVDLLHALSVLALVGLARDGCRRLGAPAPLATALAALLAVSPLVWDTVGRRPRRISARPLGHRRARRGARRARRAAGRRGAGGPAARLPALAQGGGARAVAARRRRGGVPPGTRRR